MDMTIIYGVSMFTAIVLILVAIILMARSALVSSGDVTIEINGETVATDVKLPRSMRFVDTDEASQRGIRKAIGAADLEADARIFAVDDKNKVALAYNPTIPEGNGRFVSRFPTSNGAEIQQHRNIDGFLLKYDRITKDLAALETAAKPDHKTPKAPKAKPEAGAM